MLAGRASGVLDGRIAPATGDTHAERLVHPGRLRWTPETIGWSVEGRPIDLFSNLSPTATTSVMVVAAVHGDEPATAPIANEIMFAPFPDHVDGYVIPIVNPDGWVRGMRENANLVDLNRNFPYGWLAYDGGPEPLSEPESRAVVEAISRIRPSLVIFIHQPYGWVGPIVSAAVPHARAWAAATSLRVEYGTSQHGGAETWAGKQAGVPSILVEVPSADPSPELVDRHRRGFEAALALL